MHVYSVAFKYTQDEDLKDQEVHYHTQGNKEYDKIFRVFLRDYRHLDPQVFSISYIGVSEEITEEGFKNVEHRSV